MVPDMTGPKHKCAWTRGGDQHANACRTPLPLRLNGHPPVLNPDAAYLPWPAELAPLYPLVELRRSASGWRVMRRRHLKAGEHRDFDGTQEERE